MADNGFAVREPAEQVRSKPVRAEPRTVVLRAVFILVIGAGQGNCDGYPSIIKDC